MTEIEKQFFDMFGIESIKRRTCTNADDCPDERLVCDTCEHWRIIREDYPQITDRILLELICILAKQGIYLEDMDGLFKMKTYETSMVMQNADNLKDVILKTAETACRLSKNDGFKHQVQTLFKERI